MNNESHSQENKLVNQDYRAGFLGLIGQPNAGKSSLMNFLVKEKVSIVTSKPQTTRRRVIGVHSSNEGQIVFVDAPGLVKASEGLNSFLEKEAQDVIQSADALLAVLSLSESSIELNQEILDLVIKSKKPWMAVITKTDLPEVEHRILILKTMIKELGGQVHTISNLKGTEEERELLLAEFTQLLPKASAPLYDPELYTTENVRDLAEEIIREKCFEVLNYEVPYQTAVRIRHFEEGAKPCPKIYADIYVGKESHKPILIGQGAATIKKIGQASRQEIEKIMGEKIFLDLKVTVKENWFDNKTTMKELKYVIVNE